MKIRYGDLFIQYGAYPRSKLLKFIGFTNIQKITAVFEDHAKEWHYESISQLIQYKIK